MSHKPHTYTIDTEIEVYLHRDRVAYPSICITFSLSPGSPAVMYQRNGDPGWPAESAEIELISATLIDGGGMDPTQIQIDNWAEIYLHSDNGFAHAMTTAEDWLNNERDQADEHRAEMRREDNQ